MFFFFLLVALFHYLYVFFSFFVVCFSTTTAIIIIIIIIATDSPAVAEHILYSLVPCLFVLLASIFYTVFTMKSTVEILAWNINAHIHTNTDTPGQTPLWHECSERYRRLRTSLLKCTRKKISIFGARYRRVGWLFELVERRRKGKETMIKENERERERVWWKERINEANGQKC